MKISLKLSQIAIILYVEYYVWSNCYFETIFHRFDWVMIENFYDFFGRKTYFAFYMYWTPEQKETVQFGCRQNQDEVQIRR